MADLCKEYSLDLSDSDLEQNAYKPALALSSSYSKRNVPSSKNRLKKGAELAGYGQF